jgi:Immunity protein Imm5
MSLPKHISTAVAFALNELHRHPDRLLSLERRRSIYTSFRQVDSSGQRARAQLDILTARYVLPYWQPLADRRWKSYDYMPEKMITLAEELLAGRVETEAAYKVAGMGQEMADLTGELDTSPYYCSWTAFEAALLALFSTLAYSGMAAYDVDLSDAAEHDPLKDVAHWAVIAYAGGRWYPIVTEDDNEYGEEAGIWDWSYDEVRIRRQLFWEWWLREAIPTAWSIR